MISAGKPVIIEVKKIYLVTLSFTHSPKSDKMLGKMYGWNISILPNRIISYQQSLVWTQYNNIT